MKMPELSPFPENVRSLIISQAQLQPITFSLSWRDAVFGILAGVLSGLTFVLACPGVFFVLAVGFWLFAKTGFLLACLVSLSAIAGGAAISRAMALRGRRNRVRSYLHSDAGHELLNIFGS